MKKYPLKLSYISKSAIWGGTRLMEQWNKLPNGDCIAETWELSVRPKEMATVLNGDAKGMTLQTYIELCGADCVSPSYRTDDRFPLLIKLIDAADRLSVQVHPDDAYASRVEHDSGKTEMWYIVEADPDASIIYGLADGISREEFAKAVADGRIGETMKVCPVSRGDSFFIPAGMVHAIGKGILIAEVQQNSDLTYRIYDYDRRQADGSLRELHVEKSLDVVRPFTDAEIDSLRFERGHTDALVNSKYFSVWERNIHGIHSASADEQSFVALLCLDGDGVLSYNGADYPIQKGDSCFLPAGMGAYTLSGNLRLIEATL